MSRFSNYLQYLAVCGTVAIIQDLPLRASRCYAKFLGKIGSKIPCFGGLVRTNLRVAFPDRDEAWIRRAASESLASLAMTLFEFFRLRRHPEDFESMFTCPEECERVGRAAAADKDHRLIMITPHFGNWEISGMILARHFGIKMATVVRTARNPYLDRLISSGRSVPGVEIIHSKRGMLHLVRAMENGSAAGLLIDQNTRVRDGGIFVDFFGMKCPVSRSPAILGRKLNARIIVGCSIRGKDGHFTGYLEPLSKLPSEYETDEEMLQEIMAISEKLIRLAPEQYLWMYKRFQHIPPDCPEDLRRRYPKYAAVPPPTFFDVRKKFH